MESKRRNVQPERMLTYLIMNFTTIEESKNLIELGLNKSSADMFYPYYGNKIYGDVPRYGEGKIFYTDADIPAWSIGALLELLKNYTDCNKLNIFSNRASKWSVTVSYYDQVWKEHEEIDLNLMNAVVNTTLFLLENGYIKKEDVKE